MPTTLIDFVADAMSTVKMRWQEPYVTEGLNAKLAINTPPGTYRGFRLAATGSGSPRTLSIVGSADTDHVAVVQTYNGYSLTVRRQTGSFTVDLSSPTYDNTTVVIAIYGTYTIGSPSTAVLNVYTLTEYNALTSAQKAELVILGRATTTAANNPIAASSITYYTRSWAWQNSAKDAVPWRQIITNPFFDFLPGPAVGLHAKVPGWWFTHAPMGSGTVQRSNNGIKGVGEGLAIRFRSETDTVLPELRHQLEESISVGQVLRVRVRLQCTAPITSGSLGIYLRFRDPDDGTISSAVLIGAVNANVSDASYRTEEIYWVSDRNGRIFNLEFTGSWTQAAAQYIDLGSIEAFLEAPASDKPLNSAEHTGNIFASQIDIAAQGWGVNDNSMRLEGGVVESTVPALRVVAGPGLMGGLSLSGQLEVGDLAVFNSVQAAIARLKTPIASGYRTLVWQTSNGQTISRLYFRSGSTDKLEFTQNAKWIEASSKWSKDYANGNATYLRIGYSSATDEEGNGSVGEGVANYLKLPGEISDWDHSDVLFDSTHWSVNNFRTDETGGILLGNYLTPTQPQHAVSMAWAQANGGQFNAIQNADFMVNEWWGTGGSDPNVTGTNRAFVCNRWYVRNHDAKHFVDYEDNWQMGMEGVYLTWYRQNLGNTVLVHELIQEIDRGVLLALTDTGDMELTLTWSVSKTDEYLLGAPGYMTAEIVAGTNNSSFEEHDGKDNLVSGNYAFNTTIVASAQFTPDETQQYWTLTFTVPKFLGSPARYVDRMAVRFKWLPGTHQSNAWMTWYYVNMTRGATANTNRHLLSTGNPVLERTVCRRYFATNYPHWDSNDNYVGTAFPNHNAMRLIQNVSAFGFQYLRASFQNYPETMFAWSPVGQIYDNAGSAGMITLLDTFQNFTNGWTASGDFNEAYVGIAWDAGSFTFSNHVISNFYYVDGEI